MSDVLLEKQAEEVVSLLLKSNRILFITGAGISAESGLPTYRGISGLYNQQNTEDGISIESALSGTMFMKRPSLTWKYISQIENACRGKSYNRAHEVISEMESFFNGICVLTQNVDGFHHKAGSKNIIDIHGDIHDLYCLYCKYREKVKDFSELDIPPSCPKCGRMVRPDVVLFDELLSTKKTKNLGEELRKGFDLVFSIGTSSIFPYIAQPLTKAYHDGVPTVEINPTTTRVSNLVDIKITEKAATTMNLIWILFKQKRF
ncbi:NAD-dependent protein deacylase [bacterium]|nr:NAD-dependent protein deacylase [bacterium]